MLSTDGGRKSRGGSGGALAAHALRKGMGSAEQRLIAADLINYVSR